MLNRIPQGMAANLPSNDGATRFTIELSAPVEYATDAGYESSVHLHGRHSGGDDMVPFSVFIDGLWLRAMDLIALREHISHWLQLPFDSQDLNGEFQLARLPGQGIHIRFGARPDTHDSFHPVITISFSAGALQGSFHFVTDQSCLRLFVQELSMALAGLHERS